METTAQKGLPSYTLSLVDCHGTVQYQSAAIEPLLGHRPDEVAGAAGLLFVHAEDIRPVRKAFDELVRQEGGQVRFRAAEGAWQSVEVQAHNLLADPDARGMLLSLRALQRPRTDEALR
ncbi:MAG: PAS domain-containing protein [Bacteroidota bacterium]